MAKPCSRHIALSVGTILLSSACTPLRDLDAAAAGNGTSTRGGSGANSTAQTNPKSGGASQGGATQGGATDSDQSGGVGGRTTDSTDGTGSGGRNASGGATTAEGSSSGSASGGATAEGSSSGLGDGGATSNGSTADSGGTSPLVTSTTVSTGGATSSSGGGSPGSGGTSAATGGTNATGGKRATSTIAANLGELVDPPIQGTIALSPTASWDIYGKQQESFKVATPTATYFVVKSVAAIASLADQKGLLWLNFSWDFLSNRRIPNLGGCCQLVPPSGVSQPVMTTVLDAQSATHVRLVSKPTDGDYYWLVWDFFVTHMTLTVNRSREPFGFTFDGVPGNALEDTDQFILSTGSARNATVTYSGDLPGPVEWAYLTNSELDNNESLFLIQHADDNLAESYTVTDTKGTKGSKFVFGTGQLTSTPIRFSLGLINSIDPAVVKERVAYVIKSTPQ